MPRARAQFGLCASLLVTLAACSSGTPNATNSRGSAGTANGGSSGGSAGGSGGLDGGTGGNSAGYGGNPQAGDGSLNTAGSAGNATAGSAGTGTGVGPTPTQSVAYTGSAAAKTQAAGLLNLGQEFTVTAPSIVVRDLGFWDQGADGLVSPHAVTLFSLDKTGAGGKGTPVPGGSVTVPAGMVGEFDSGFRFAPLASPLTLQAGNYAVIAYGLNANDEFGEGGNVPLASSGVSHANYDPFQFVSTASPAYPSGGDNNEHTSASFRFDQIGPDFIRIMPLGDSITDGVGSSGGGYRIPLKKLLDDAKISFQFVGSSWDNPGSLPRDQWHHEGHPGWTIQAGTSGRAGLLDNVSNWLGAGGNRPDVILLMIGTNDVDISYDLGNAEKRLDTLVTTLLDKTYGLVPSAKLVLAQLVPIQDATEDARCATYNQSVAKVAAAHQKRGENVKLVDMHAALTAPGDFNDKLHPNDSGYVKMAKVWFDALK